MVKRLFKLPLLKKEATGKLYAQTGTFARAHTVSPGLRNTASGAPVLIVDASLTQ